jgi:hypothetical protein
MCLAGLSAVFLLPCRAEKPAQLEPRLVAPGAVELAETFEAYVLSPAWHVRTGDWLLKGGTLTGRKVATDKHPAKIELMQPWSAGSLALSFKVDGPGGLDLDFYEAATRVAVLRMRNESLSFGTYPKTGPSNATILGQTERGLAPDAWHTILIERKGETLHIQGDTGLSLHVAKTGLEAPFSSTLVILRGPPERTILIDDVKLSAGK